MRSHSCEARVGGRVGGGGGGVGGGEVGGGAHIKSEDDSEVNK